MMLSAIGCFHDGTISSLQRLADSLVLKVEIQYLAKLIDTSWMTRGVVSIHYGRSHN